jgi:hypothetical protein
MRRIEDALDAPGGIDSDAELRAMLAADPEARAYADDLVRIGDRLQAMGETPDVDGEKLAARIEARVFASEKDEPLDDLDVLSAPVFEDEAVRDDERPAPMVSQEVPVAAAARPNVVDLSSRRTPRTSYYWMGGLAAAAAVGLGIVIGMQTMGSDAEQSVAMAPAPSADYAEEAMEAEAPAEEVARQQMPMQAPAAAMPVAPAEPMAAEPDPAAFALAERGEGAERRAMGGMGGGLGPVDLARPVSPAMITNTLRGANDAVARCIMNVRAPVMVSVRVNADGSFDRVTIGTPYTDTPEGACIERSVRALRMPASDAPYEGGVQYHPAGTASSSQADAMRPAARMRAAREVVPQPQAAPRPARRPAEHGSEVLDPFH